ncbi:MAG: NADH:ubiquinone oxidoreductase subunit NDUFA12 [Rhizobiales bacterium]|nr:NADH:ubiquinone oxidoreductase subunit NDUFA12 [Hyphomicrobiales bacterium]
MEFLKQIFTWWSGQTIGTRFFTWRKGEHVGTDESGNRYYRAKSAIPDSIPERRWVIYNGYAEASAIPPGWHGWIHHRVDEFPAGAASAREWEKPHQPNLTGTPHAYRPAGSILAGSKTAAAPDYQPWRPE